LGRILVNRYEGFFPAIILFLKEFSMTTEELLFAMEFIFSANDQKGYQKLKDNQFAKALDGLIREPLSNAIDQQNPNDPPIEIDFRPAGDGLWALRFKDRGAGLTVDNLLSLHYIGRSSKRKNQAIGRFGMGLVGAFHSSFGIEKVEILTQVCGEPARIFFDCHSDRIPLWRQEVLETPVSGFEITFFIPESKARSINSAISAFLENSIVPVIFNGNLLQRRLPDALIKKPLDIVTHRKEDGLEIYHVQHIKEPNWNNIDHLQIYLRKILLEENDLYDVFVQSSGDKMPQNYYSVAYIFHESCCVITENGEPTVGRDALVRNADFEFIKNKVHEIRAAALLTLLESAGQPSTDPAIRKIATMSAIVNLKSLYHPLTATLKNEGLSESAQYLEPLIQGLLAFPCLPVFESEHPISLNQLLAVNPPKGIYFYAESEDAARFLQGEHQCPFVINEKRDLLWLFGGHRRYLVDDLLNPILKSIGCELVMLDELMWNPERVAELEKQGVIVRKHIRFSVVNPETAALCGFLERLKATVNQAWFRQAIARFHPPKKIQLQIIRLETPVSGGEIIACVLEGFSSPEELVIAIVEGSSVLKSIIRHPQGELAFIPILCHEMAHSRRLVNGNNSLVGHTPGFFLNRIMLEDQVLKNCACHLLGKDLPIIAAGDHNLPDQEETLVL
jgi:hypothetical protein